MLNNCEVIVVSDPQIDLPSKKFQIEVEVTGRSSKWAGYPTKAVLHGAYDLALMQSLQTGARLTVTGGYNSAFALTDFGRIEARSIKPAAVFSKKAFDIPAAISLMSVEDSCGNPVDPVVIQKLRTDRYLAWEQDLASQGIWIEHTVSAFLCANPEHFDVPGDDEDPLQNQWVRLSYALDRAGQENPYLPRGQWVAPRPMVEALIGSQVTQALFSHAIKLGKEIIAERPGGSLSSLRLDA
jgi:hypothetical protein